jgi:hypothetical protein
MPVMIIAYVHRIDAPDPAPSHRCDFADADEIMTVR